MSSKRLLAAILCLIVVEILVWRSGHRTLPELEAAAAEAPLEERMFALHILANRGEPRVFPPARLSSLLSHPEPLMREFAMTRDFGRGEAVQLQRGVVQAGEATRRMRFFLRFRKMHLRQEHIGWYFEDN